MPTKAQEAVAIPRSHIPTPPPAIDPGLLDRFQAADYLNIGERYLRKLAYEGVVKSVKVGRRRLYARDDLDAYIASKRA